MKSKKSNSIKQIIVTVSKYLLALILKILFEHYIITIFAIMLSIILITPISQILFDILHIKLFRFPPQFLVGHLILICLFISFIYVFYRFIGTTKRKSMYYFIKEGGFKWRINKHTGFVTESPFCSLHQIELNRTSRGIVGYRDSIVSLSCDICNKIIAQDIRATLIKDIYDKVCRMAKAKHNNYANF